MRRSSRGSTPSWSTPAPNELRQPAAAVRRATMTSETYAEGGAAAADEPAASFITIISCMSALLLIAALIYALLGTSERTQAALLRTARVRVHPDALHAAMYDRADTEGSVPGGDNPGRPAAEHRRGRLHRQRRGSPRRRPRRPLKAEVDIGASARRQPGGLRVSRPSSRPLAKALIQANQARADAHRRAGTGRPHSPGCGRSTTEFGVADAAVQTEMKLVLAAVDAPAPWFAEPAEQITAVRLR